MGRYLLQLCDRVGARFLLMVSISQCSDQALSMMSFLPGVLTQHNFLLSQCRSQDTPFKKERKMQSETVKQYYYISISCAALSPEEL